MNNAQRKSIAAIAKIELDTLSSQKIQQVIDEVSKLDVNLAWSILHALGQIKRAELLPPINFEPLQKSLKKSQELLQKLVSVPNMYLSRSQETAHALIGQLEQLTKELQFDSLIYNSSRREPIIQPRRILRGKKHRKITDKVTKDKGDLVEIETYAEVGSKPLKSRGRGRPPTQERDSEIRKLVDFIQCQSPSPTTREYACELTSKFLKLCNVLIEPKAVRHIADNAKVITMRIFGGK